MIDFVFFFLNTFCKTPSPNQQIARTINNTTKLINTNKLKQFIGFPVVTFAARWTYGPSAHGNGKYPG